MPGPFSTFSTGPFSTPFPFSEIKTGQRRVIEYFLIPLLQYQNESLRER